jgi:hypothetical protein
LGGPFVKQSLDELLPSRGGAWIFAGTVAPMPSSAIVVTRSGLQFNISSQPAPDSHIVGLASAAPESNPAHRLLSLTRDGNFPLVGFADMTEQQNCGIKGVAGIFHPLYMG